MYGLAVFWLWR